MPPTIRLPRNPAVLRALQRVAAIPSHDGPRPRRDAAAAATARSASRRVDADGRAGWRSGAAWRAVAGDGRRGLAGGRGGIVQARKDENDAAKGEEEGKVAVDAKPLLEQHGFMLVEDQAKEVLRIDYVQRVGRCPTAPAPPRSFFPASHLLPELSEPSTQSLAPWRMNCTVHLEPMQQPPTSLQPLPPPHAHRLLRQCVPSGSGAGACVFGGLGEFVQFPLSTRN